MSQLTLPQRVTLEITAKGWTSGLGNEAVCDNCHPDNQGGHSTINGTVLVDAGIYNSGSGSTTTCSSTPVGCHNGNTTPA